MRRRFKFIAISVLVVFIALAAMVLSNRHRLNIEKDTRLMMGTFVTISVVGHKEFALEAIDAAFARIKEIDEKFYFLNPKSPIYAFNNFGTAIIDTEILTLIKAALECSEKSDGAFDITVAPLMELWGFHEKASTVPQDEAIKDVLKSVGYKHLLLSADKLEKDAPGVKIDLGGIAKGHAIAEAIKVLKSKGVVSALVNAGGDVYALGRKGRNLWKIGVKDPRGEGILGYVEAEDIAVIGSGDYEQFFIKNKKRYHHILNPKTGYSIEGVDSVTVIYKDAVLAQGWAKVPFIVGPQKGLQLMEKIPGMEVIIITNDGKKFFSAGLKHALKTK